MAGQNAYLSYEAGGTTHQLPLYIQSIAQPLQVTGSTAQGRVSRQFYPRAHAPGDIAVNGQCLSQADYQRLALFIREHQRMLINTPGTVMFNRTSTNSEGYRRLMKLYVIKEGVLVRGFIPRFTITKKGHFDPAPKYSFNFTVIFDPYAENIAVSSAVRKYYSDADNYSSNKVAESAADEFHHRDNLP
jgi:hypothetical protein